MFQLVAVRIALVSSLLATFTQFAWAETRAQIVWQSDVLKAYRHAQSIQKPLVIYFYAKDTDGLAPLCCNLEEGALASRELAAFGDRAVFVRVNVALRDTNGNVKKFAEGLNVKSTPAVAVLECRQDQWSEHGQIIGYFDTPEFVRKFRSNIVAAMIAIRRNQQRPLTSSELVHRTGKFQIDFNRLSDEFLRAAELYASQKAALANHGEFQADAFVDAGKRRRASQQKMMNCLLDFAALPADPPREFGQVMLEMLMLDYDATRRLEHDLVEPTLQGRLVGPVSVEHAQATLYTFDRYVDAETIRLQEAIDRAKQKL